VSDQTIFEEIYPAVIAAGFCPSNVAFGMGEHNHKAVRSETEHAYKTCLVGAPYLAEGPDAARVDRLPVADKDSDYRAVMKSSESLFKRSLPCAVSLDFSGAASGDCRNRVQRATVAELKQGNTGELVVLYDGRPKPLAVQTELFEQSRERAYES